MGIQRQKGGAFAPSQDCPTTMRPCPSMMVVLAFVGMTASLVATGVDGWALSPSFLVVDPAARLSQSSSFLSSSRRITSTPNPSSISLTSLSSSASGDGESSNRTNRAGLNELQTLLREAVSSENYKEAGRLRDEVANLLEESNSNGGANADGNTPDPRKYQRLSWTGLGTAPWLVARLEALEYSLPTTIQIHAFESINQMLLQQQSEQQKLKQQQQQQQQPNGGGYSKTTSTSSLDQQTLGQLMDSTSSTSTSYDKAKSSQDSKNNMAVIVSGSTGSGKTLAYLVPLLSTLSESLFDRQRIRVKAEADVTDAADDLLSRVAVQTSPEVRGSRPGQGSANAEKKRGTLSLGKSGRDVTTPLSLIVVPTRELGVQTALLLYELVGGSLKREATDFSGEKNMFKYKGPRGVKIACVLDERESEIGLAFQTDVAITTPKYLSKLLAEHDVKPDKLRVIAFDEADLALEQTSNDDLKQLFEDPVVAKKSDDDEDDEDDIDDFLDRSSNNSRLTYLVGASVTDSLRDIPVVRDFVLPEGKTYLATATTFNPLQLSNANADDDSTSQRPKTSLSQLRLRLDPGLIHERVVAEDNTGLLCLSRMLRRELKDYTTSLENPDPTKRKSASPRVVIFFPDEDEAKKSMIKLRDAMWGDFKLCVLLPDTGVSPMSVMEDFKLNKTSVMLATPNSVRGLDFAGLTHVYTLYLPANDPREYVHLAGRVGRIGQLGSAYSGGTGGRVTSILRPEEAEQMTELAQKLDFDFVDVDYIKAEFPSFIDVDVERDANDEDDDDNYDVDGYDASDNTDNMEADQVEEFRRYLEDTITLLGGDDDDSVKDGNDDDTYDDDDADDDEDDEPYDSEEEMNAI
jgi:superfamily II DNA/RNA helicase